MSKKPGPFVYYEYMKFRQAYVDIRYKNIAPGADCNVNTKNWLILKSCLFRVMKIVQFRENSIVVS